MNFLLRVLSRTVGWSARLRVPLLSAFAARIFARLLKIEQHDAEFPLDSYRNVAQLFTRRLKPECRRLAEPPLLPVDGVLRSAGRVHEGLMLQVKGCTYSIAKLLRDDERAARFSSGAFINCYLSPRDYHRVHAPVDGALLELCHIPGKLWPVNRWAIDNIEDLFCVNERVILYLESSSGLVAVVMVAALNVGQISVAHDRLVTNMFTPPWRTPNPTSRHYERPIAVEAGDELGCFHLGSSVVVLFEHSPASVNFEPSELQIRIKMGGAIASALADSR